MQDATTKPYLIRAIYEWCSDSGLTPYLAVAVDKDCRVPMEFVKEGEIVLNISASATPNLLIDNEWIGFSARFGGVGAGNFCAHPCGHWHLCQGKWPGPVFWPR